MFGDFALFCLENYNYTHILADYIFSFPQFTSPEQVQGNRQQAGLTGVSSCAV